MYDNNISYTQKDKPSISIHFLYAQMALVSTFIQMFIVLGMYNFDKTIKTICKATASYFVTNGSKKGDLARTIK